MGWNIKTSLDHIVSNASKKSKELCARYVREAVHAGGNKILPEGGDNAACYANSLYKYGFRIVFEDKVGSFGNAPNDKYTPKDGDIAVLAASASHKCGHIEMFVSNSKEHGKNFGENKWFSDYPGNNLNCYQEARVIRIFRYTGDTTNS